MRPLTLDMRASTQPSPENQRGYPALRAVGAPSSDEDLRRDARRYRRLCREIDRLLDEGRLSQARVLNDQARILSQQLYHRHKSRHDAGVSAFTPDARVEWSQFCGHCGAAAAIETPAPVERACAACGQGMLVEARANDVPTVDDAFLIVDSSLSVRAISPQAELALGVPEQEAVSRHITELLIPADVENQRTHGLAVAITQMAGGGESPARVFVRPTRTFGVRLQARIAACGPRPAALIVLE